MAVEVLVESDSYKIRCPHCGVELRYTSDDIRSYVRRVIFLPPHSERWINCPRCLNRVLLK